MILSTLKAKFVAGAAIALGVLLTLVKVLVARNQRLSARVEVAEARVNHARVVAKKDIETERTTASHRAELINEINDTGESTGFRDANSLWDDTDD